METGKIIKHHLGEDRLKLFEPLARFTTLKTGGAAQYFFVARNTAELVKAFNAAREAKIPFTILGGGSNVLISDHGIKGLVVKNESNSIKIIKRLGKIKNGSTSLEQALVEVDAGVLVNKLVRFVCDEGLGGLERHLGLPGTIGGAIFMNSKWTKPVTYTGDAVYQAKIIARNGEIKLVNKKYFDFAYDWSILQKTHEIVLSVIFLLKATDQKILWERANFSMEYRKKTQPMGVSTAGCTFRNISLSQAFRILTPNNTTSAGYLIDQVGLKYFQVGGAKFSHQHANFILNLGNATSKDVKALIDEAKKRVKTKFAVTIEPEIVLLGEF